MAARDNVLFGTSIASGTAAGTVVPLSLVYGIENVRQGYGTPKLKSVRALYTGGYSGTTQGITVTVKNSNWVDAAGLVAQRFSGETSINRDSLAYMRGRDKVLSPNTAWIINAEVDVQTTAAAFLWVLLEIEYTEVPGINPENAAGSPVVKKCANASVTASPGVPVSLGSFDNLLQDVTYVLSEVSASGLSGDGAFIIIEGFSNQKGLTRIIPVKSYGLSDQIEGSVYLTKQTYGVSVISASSLSAVAVSVQMEMIASRN